MVTNSNSIANANADQSANSWHQSRRKLILEKHPEISKLTSLKDSHTITRILLVSPIHLCFAVFCGIFELNWPSVLLLAAVFGGALVFQMFNNGHELCHDAIDDRLKSGKVKDYLLHWILLPDVNPMQWM